MGWVVMSLLAGALGIGFGMRETAHQRRLRHEGVSAEGRVVRHLAKTGPRGVGVSFTPVVTFVDVHGLPHEFQANVSGVEGLLVGGRAPVRYLPGAPGSARLDLAGKRVASTVGLLLIGAVFGAVGIWLLVTGA